MFELLSGCLVFVTLLVTTGGFTCYSGQTISDDLRCSGKYDCTDGSDEIECNTPLGSLFNNSCGADNYSYTEEQKCDGFPNCFNCFDELDCSDMTNQKISPNYFSCDNESKCLPLTWLCDGVIHCTDRSDEKQIGFGFKCNGIPTDGTHRIPNSTAATAVPYRCIIPQQNIRLTSSKKRLSVCFSDKDDCYTFKDGKSTLNTSKCWPCLDGTIIQRQQVCNAVFDCADLSDECLCESQLAKEVCDPLLRDNNCSRKEVSCELGTKCMDVHEICDGSNDCPRGSDEMGCTNTLDCSKETIECYGFKCNRINAVKCDGRIECSSGEDECGAECPVESPYCDWFDCNWYDNQPNLQLRGECEDLCGPRPGNVCDKKKDCEDSSDELFCPLLKHCDQNDLSSPVYHDHCLGDRCNLVADCENLADEMNCSPLTHFYCDNNKKFLPLSRKFDGNFDCDDYTDECPVTSTSVSSSTELIGNKFFYVILWIIMILAVVGNLIIIMKTYFDIVEAIPNIRRSPTTTGLCFNIMLLNLAVSDFLMGFYLLFIASKSVEFSGTYCTQKREWLLSNQCVFAGVLAVISSQMSVCMLVVMASYRLYAVLRPFKAKFMGWKRLISKIACMWVLSILLAVIPTIPSMNLKLETKIIMDQPYIQGPVTTSQFIHLIKMVNKLPGERQPIPEITSLSHSHFCQIFNKSAISQFDCEESSPTTYGYYSTDGVCLPRYYGASFERAFNYSFGVVLINFGAFFYMFMVYVVLYYSASYKHQDSQGNVNSVCQAQAKRSKELSGTIMRIIITDFLCWMPICIMSFISYGGIEIPGLAYQITAIFLIPINSAVNPWIYSSFLARKIKNIPSLIRIQMQQRQAS